MPIALTMCATSFSYNGAFLATGVWRNASVQSIHTCLERRAAFDAALSYATAESVATQVLHAMARWRSDQRSWPRKEVDALSAGVCDDLVASERRACLDVLAVSWS